MTKKSYMQVDLEKYYPLGIPMLKLMFLIISLSMMATLTYELIK